MYSLYVCPASVPCLALALGDRWNRKLTASLACHTVCRITALLLQPAKSISTNREIGAWMDSTWPKVNCNFVMFFFFFPYLSHWWLSRLECHCFFFCFFLVVFTIYRVAESFIKYCIKLLFHLKKGWYNALFTRCKISL